MFTQINVTATELKTLVEAGKSLQEICDAFKDSEGKSLPIATAKRYLKDCGLKIKKTRRSRFVLVTKDSNNNAEVESTTATENNESVAEVESEGATA
jgi:hypothetical protein